MNVTSIAGNIGKDAEVRQLDSGKQVTTFSVAVKGWKETVWFNCVSFRDNHAKLAPHLLKGGSVAVSGSMQFDKADGGAYWPKLVVNEITLLGKKESADSVQPRGFDEVQEPFDDDLPF